MTTLNRRPSLLVRTVFVALAVVCFGALQLVSGQVEIGPRSKHVPRTTPKATARRAVAGTVIDLSNGARLEMVLVPAGSFQMGSNSGQDDEKPVHRVTITKPFFIGKYEVTQGQWRAVMGENPSKFIGGDELPVEQVSWNDCQEFIRRLNAETGMKFRLPTEAEWEYACRSGTTGNWAGNLSSVGWYYENSGRSLLSDSSWSPDAASSNRNQTHPVGQLLPNGWGLYDMHGNVVEWCQDWYNDDYYVRSPTANPAGGAEGIARVNRGGYWNSNGTTCRSAERTSSAPNARFEGIGFRLARTQ